MEEVDAARGRQRGQAARERLKLGLAPRRPVQRLVQPDEVGVDAPRLRPLIGAGGRPLPDQHGLGPFLLERARRIQRIAPDAADGVEGHQDAARTGHGAARNEASKTASGSGRCSWMSLKAEKALR